MHHVRRSPRPRRRLLAGAAPILLLLASCGGGAPGTTPPPPSSTVQLAPGDDVAAAVASASAGTTLHLAAGTYALPQGLVVDKDLTFEGDTGGGVSLVSDAAKTTAVQSVPTRGAPVVTVTGGTFTASDVSFTYTGSLPADVLVVSAGALDLQRVGVEGGVGGAFGVGNGVALAPGTTATIRDSTLSGNDACGISQGSGVTPTLQGNTFTGNGGGDVCDAAPVPGVDTRACTVGDDAKNPDPARYLAVVVTLADGTPVANAGVGLSLLSNGAQTTAADGTTDANGVALMLDTQTDTWPNPGGSYLGVATAYGAGATPAGVPFVVSACPDVGYPSTVHLVVDAPNLVDQTFSARVAGTEVGEVSVFPGITLDGAALFPAAWLGAPPFDVRMPAGPHPVLYATGVGLYTTATPPAYMIQRLESIDGTAVIRPDIDQEPRYTLDVGIDANAPAGMTLASLVSFLNGADARSFVGYDLTVDQLAVTPGSYDVTVWTQMKDTQGASWSYSWAPPIHDLTPAGGSGSVTVGGALSMTLETPGTLYAPGDIVNTAATVVDPHGNTLDWLVDRGTLPAQGVAGPAPRLHSTAVGPQRLAPSAAGVHGDMHLVIRDPQGTIVFDDTSDTLYGSYALPNAAATGTYSAEFTWAIGPYRSTPLSASTTFDVQ